MSRDRILGTIVVVVIIVAAIYFLEGLKPNTSGDTQVVELASEGMADQSSVKDKEKMYASAKEIVNPTGFVNVDDLKLADLIGNQVILVDFWTYSCINCQRTQPYLNAWQEKYGDKGLTIVGMHTPEFEFEKDIDNVKAAVEKAGIEYPVVLDNDYATWRAYGNRYWPRKYLVDIDGYIVYDHIGEGGYEETEEKIQELLAERSRRLGEESQVSEGVVEVEADTPSVGVESPEVYFGSLRNELLANGQAGLTGEQIFAEPSDAPLNDLLLGGTWDIQPEYAVAVSDRATITFRYKAAKVFMVAAADEPVVMTVRRDGELIGKFAGSDVDGDGQVTISDEQLYSLVEEDGVSEHTLELTIEGLGLQAFTFTFG